MEHIITDRRGHLSGTLRRVAVHRFPRTKDLCPRANSASTQGSWVEGARGRGFIGREHELRRLLTAIHEEDGARLHFIYGPGGIGKTELLRELARQCAHRGLRVGTARPRDLNSSRGQPLAAAGVHSLDVLLIDSGLLQKGLEELLRSDRLESLPRRMHLVIASRQRPGPAWRTKLGWANLVYEIALSAFNSAETTAFLDSRCVAEIHHEPLERVTGGHPLALALAVESGPTNNLPELSHDVVIDLIGRIREEVPCHRLFAALEAACAVRVTQERLLAHLLEIDDARELFDSLCVLSFIQQQREGLAPSDLVRSVVGSQARDRDPVGTDRLYSRARAWYRERLLKHQDQPYGPGSTRTMLDLTFLHQANPIGRELIGERTDDALLTLPARGHDLEQASAMVARHQGSEARRWFELWASRQPEQVFVCRDSARQPVGMVQYVLLSNEDLDAAKDDPCTRATLGCASRHAPLRADEKILLTRFWTDAEGRQKPGPVANHLWIHASTHIRLIHRLALSMVAVQQPMVWEQAFHYIDFQRAEDTDDPGNALSPGLFVHDWRLRPVRQWNRLLARRQLDPCVGSPTGTHDVTLLDEQAFARAVRDALRFFRRIAHLERNALLTSPLMLHRTRGSLDSRRKALQKLIGQGVEALRGDPTGDKLHRAITATYLEPSGTQEEVAEILDLPFTTYRRHLTRAVRELTDWLWCRELGREK